MTQYKIVNRISRKEQILNYDEFIRFMKKNSMREYTYTPIKSDDYKLQQTLCNIQLGILGFLFVIVATKLIMQWI